VLKWLGITLPEEEIATTVERTGGHAMAAEEKQ
jgi:hypothetical protein